jgi:hypothetical protein
VLRAFAKIVQSLAVHTWENLLNTFAATAEGVTYMKECVACDNHQGHYKDEHLFDAVRTWLWEEAPYLLRQFPAMKYTAKQPTTGRTILCRQCLINHLREWLEDVGAPIGVRQRFNQYFGYEPVQRQIHTATHSVTWKTTI